MKRILHVVPATPFGGLQRVAALLAAEQKRRGLTVHVLALYASSQFQELLIQYDLPHTVIPGSGPSVKAFRSCRRIFSEEWSFLHIHGGLLWSNTIALFAKRAPVVYHAHNYPPTGGSFKWWLLNRINKSLVDVVIAVSRDVAKAWRSARIGSIVEVVYNAVELPSGIKSDRTLPSNRPVVFGVATRLARDKGVFEFIEVAATLHERNPGTRFVIAGEGSEREALQEKIRKCRLSEVFLLPGHVSNLDAFWAGVDVALFTAPKEPFGLRILEAMIRKVPVVGYLTGAGSDEILCSGLTAITAPYADAKALASAALNLCNNPNAYADLRNAAYHDVISRFSAASLHEGVMRAYNRVARL